MPLQMSASAAELVPLVEAAVAAGGSGGNVDRSNVLQYMQRTAGQIFHSKLGKTALLLAASDDVEKQFEKLVRTWHTNKCDCRGSGGCFCFHRHYGAFVRARAFMRAFVRALVHVLPSLFLLF